MKSKLKMIFWVVLLGITQAVAQIQSVNYTENTGVSNNPERGFFHSLSTLSSSNPTKYIALTQSSLDSYRATENITTIQRLFYLNDFLNSSISSTYLMNIQSDFTKLRSSGCKAIIRFSYSKVEGTTQQQPTKAMILTHISQLAPILNSNKDVISTIQGGFIGTWGEWYHTNSSEFGHRGTINTTQWNNRNSVLTAMENSFSSDIPLQVRYVDILVKLRPLGTTRIGLYNDAFLNSWGNQGTFNVNCLTCTNPTQETYLQNLTVNLPMTGETDGVYQPKTDCLNALLEMDRYNWSLINKDYHQTVIQTWQSSGCFLEMQKKLGYRVVLKTGVLNGKLLQVRMVNTGFSNFYKKRKMFVVLKGSTGQLTSFEVLPDIRIWRKNQDYQLNFNIPDSVPPGQYTLYLYLPDPSSSDTRMAIQFSNIGTWESNTGMNNLLLNYNKPVTNTQRSFSKSTRIFNIFGEELKSSTETLPSGIYIIKKETTEGEIQTNKILKK